MSKIGGNMFVKVGGFSINEDTAKREVAKHGEVDANSQAAGQYKNEVTFGGAKAFVTDEGKAYLDGLSGKAGYRFTVEKNFVGRNAAEAFAGSRE